MAAQTIEELQRKVEALISGALEAYDLILQIRQATNVGQRRIFRLFEAAPAEPAPIVAYRHEPEDVWFGFDAGSGLSAKWRRHEGGPPESGALGFRNSIEIDIADPGSSSWFSLEFSLPWSDFRAFRQVSLTIAGQGSEPSKGYFRLRGHAKDGKSHDLAALDVDIAAATGVSRKWSDIVVPHDVFFDFEKSPTAILFFDVKPMKVQLNVLNLTFE